MPPPGRDARGAAWDPRPTAAAAARSRVTPAPTSGARLFVRTQRRTLIFFFPGRRLHTRPTSPPPSRPPPHPSLAENRFLSATPPPPPVPTVEFHSCIRGCQHSLESFIESQRAIRPFYWSFVGAMGSFKGAPEAPNTIPLSRPNSHSPQRGLRTWADFGRLAGVSRGGSAASGLQAVLSPGRAGDPVVQGRRAPGSVPGAPRPPLPQLHRARWRPEALWCPDPAVRLFECFKLPGRLLDAETFTSLRSQMDPLTFGKPAGDMNALPRKRPRMSNVGA